MNGLHLLKTRGNGPNPNINDKNQCPFLMIIKAGTD